MSAPVSGYETSIPPADCVDVPCSTPDYLVTLLLEDQQRLTAVEKFAQRHQNGENSDCLERYSSLLPASPPQAGQQYAFEVDLDCCSGCKSCVTACHSLNGLDEDETWRDVGLLVGGTTANPVMQHVTTACHHCLQPACMSACPVDAYEKDPATGIVKHLDDQCFGCQYCTLACPYDVPKYRSHKGIVRKCDMCSDRLAAGEPPACAQACPTSAISIKVVNVEQVAEDCEADHFLPAAPDPSLTLPTTTYKTGKVLPRNTLPADYYSVSPQQPHWPLIAMLVLTQLSVGAFSVAMLLESLVDATSLADFRPVQASNGLLFGVLAVSVSVLHLGRPQYAFRAVIGLKHSWLSREIVAFGIFGGLASVYAASCWLANPGAPWLAGLGWSVAASGLFAVFCSVMVYVFTNRELWTFSRTATRFLLTAAVLGIAATWLTILLLEFATGAQNRLGAATEANLAQGLVISTLCKLTFDAAVFRHLAATRNSQLKRSARLMVDHLSNCVFARFALGFLGGVAMPLFLIARDTTSTDGDAVLTIMVAMLFSACLLGELLERYLFFAAAQGPRMPGGLRP